MRELSRVVAEAERAERAGTPLVLATVVNVEGSTYRRPGARLLVAEDRWLAGGVSGGCLEDDVLKRAFWRTAGGDPVLVSYDSRSEDEGAWAQALGCNGLVEVVLERLEPRRRIHPLRTVAAWLREGTQGVLVTVFAAPPGAARVGDRAALAAGGESESEVPGALGERLLVEAGAALAAGRSRVIRLPWDEGEVRALVEVVVPPPTLVVMGEGPDVPPVIELARTLGWRTRLVVSRHTTAAAGAEAAADEVVVSGNDELPGKLPLGGARAVVLMTHSFPRDLAALRFLLGADPPLPAGERAHDLPLPSGERARDLPLPSGERVGVRGAPARSPASALSYLGVLGPRRRTERLLHDLRQEKVALDAEALERLFTPVGLDLGAEEPEEIALALVAEIQAVLHGRTGRSLRESAGPIHRPAPAGDAS
jgi:xanthine/CO dehydrogenase XdhC/CoxF family maturation factor